MASSIGRLRPSGSLPDRRPTLLAISRQPVCLAPGRSALRRTAAGMCASSPVTSAETPTWSRSGWTARSGSARRGVPISMTSRGSPSSMAAWRRGARVGRSRRPRAGSLRVRTGPARRGAARRRLRAPAPARRRLRQDPRVRGSHRRRRAARARSPRRSAAYRGGAHRAGERSRPLPRQTCDRRGNRCRRRGCRASSRARAAAPGSCGRDDHGRHPSCAISRSGGPTWRRAVSSVCPTTSTRSCSRCGPTGRSIAVPRRTRRRGRRMPSCAAIARRCIDSRGASVSFPGSPGSAKR